MPISESFSGSATIGTTEYDLCNATTTKSSQTTDGVFQLFLELNNLTANEQYTLRIYEKVRSGTAQRLVEQIEIYGAQTAEPIYVTPALLFLHGWTYTLQRVNTGGSSADRSIAWSIRQIA